MFRTISKQIFTTTRPTLILNNGIAQVAYKRSMGEFVAEKQKFPEFAREK